MSPCNLPTHYFLRTFTFVIDCVGAPTYTEGLYGTRRIFIMLTRQNAPIVRLGIKAKYPWKRRPAVRLMRLFVPWKRGILCVLY